MTFPQKLLNPGEHVVVSTRTHPKVLIGPILIAVVIAVAAVLLSTVVSGVAVWIVWGVAVLALLAVLVRPVLRWATTTYTFTNRRFVKRSGFIAKEGRTIPLNRISGVDFEFGVVDRMFGCGTLIVTDASEQGRVDLHDIPRVEQVQLQVAEELHRLTSGPPGTPLGEHRSDDGS